MTVLITLVGILGTDTGPTFNLYSSPDGITFTTIELGVDKTDLVEAFGMPGYYATVPNDTTKIKVTSVGDCTNFEVATIDVIPPLYYEHTLSVGYVNSSTACSDTTPLWTVYTINPIISAEDILFTDNGFTDGLIGGLLYYKDINGSNYFKVRDNGSVELIGSCTPPVNSVEWISGDYPPIAYGTSPGDIISLSGTVEIIGTPVTFRAYAFFTGPGDGGVDTSINIGNIDVGIISRYVDAVTPYDNGINQYSTSFTLPAGIYDWSVLCTFSNVASVGGEGGIDWVQA